MTHLSTICHTCVRILQTHVNSLWMSS